MSISKLDVIIYIKMIYLTFTSEFLNKSFLISGVAVCSNKSSLLSKVLSSFILFFIEVIKTPPILYLIYKYHLHCIRQEVLLVNSDVNINGFSFI